MATGKSNASKRSASQSAAPGERLYIHLLGGFRVTVGEREIDPRAWRQRRVASLVKVLALAPPSPSPL